MAYSLTATQRRCLLAIESLQAGGARPTLGELATTLGFRNKSSVIRLLDLLQERGWIVRGPRGSVAITVVQSLTSAEAPFIGLFDPPPHLARELAHAARLYRQQAQEETI